MDIRQASALGPFAQAFPQFLRTLRPRKQSFQQGPKVKPGSPNDDGQVSARLNLSQNSACPSRILPGSHILHGIDKIKEMVRSLGSFSEARLRRPDVEIAVHGDRIAVNDLALELLGKR